MTNRQFLHSGSDDKPSWMFHTSRLLVFVVLVAVVGGIAQLFLSSAATSISAYGRLYDSRTGHGISSAKVFICDQGRTLTTDSGGYFRFNIATGAYYCARVTAGKPSGWTGPVLSNRPEHATAKTYENQVAGKNCYHVSTCPSATQTWDRASDTGIYFKYTSPTPPPPAPSISSFKAAPSTIRRGQSSTLSWSSNGDSCKLNDGSSSKTVGRSGSTEVRPTRSTTYSLKCYNSGGSSPVKKATVTVVGVVTGGTPPTSSGGSHKAPDKTPPTKPSGFTAAMDPATQTVDLSWQAATDNVGVKAYQLERSEDKHKWTNLSANITQTNYIDQTANFNTDYTYRLRAVDAAGNASGYVVASITTSNFQANTSPDSDNTVTSDDNVVSILISAGTFDKPAFCSIITSTDILTPNIQGYVFISGPYQLNCRSDDGALITTFNKPPVVTVQLSSSSVKKISRVDYFGQNDDESWQKLNITSHDKKSLTDTVDLGGHTIFTIMGKQKKSSFLLVLLKIVLVIAVILAIASFIIRRLLRRRAQQQYDEYLRKSEGL